MVFEVKSSFSHHIQGDTKNGHNQKSNNFQTFIQIDTKLQLHQVKPVQQTSPKSQVCITKLFVSLALKNVLQMSSPALQAHLDPSGKVLDDTPAFLPWDRSYCGCDCCLQVRDSLGVVAKHPVLKVSPQIKIWGVQAGMRKRKRWKRSFFCGSGSRSEKILPLPLPHRLFDLKSNLAKKFCPFSNVD